MTATSSSGPTMLTPEGLLEHWQGHRRLTRRVIDTFPEDGLFHFSLGGMRPFSDLAAEFLRMAVPSLRGVATGEWTKTDNLAFQNKAELLSQWDRATEELNRLWPQIPPHRFQEVDKAYGMWEGTGINLLLYVIDNEVHHRGQGYVYLRALGVEPPPFWERG